MLWSEEPFYCSSDSSDLLDGGSKSAPRCGGGQEGMADLWKWHGHAELAPCPRGRSRWAGREVSLAGIRHGSTEPAWAWPKHTGWCARPTEVMTGAGLAVGASLFTRPLPEVSMPSSPSPQATCLRSFPSHGPPRLSSKRPLKSDEPQISRVRQSDRPPGGRPRCPAPGPPGMKGLAVILRRPPPSPPAADAAGDPRSVGLQHPSRERRGIATSRKRGHHQVDDNGGGKSKGGLGGGKPPR